MALQERTPKHILLQSANWLQSEAVIGVATQYMTSGQNGEICIGGAVNGINTSMFTDGQVVYLGSAGQLISTKPSAPSAILRVGGVVLYSHAVNGILLVDKQLSPKELVTQVM